MALNWKATLKSVAPALASAIGGPIGGTAMRILAGTLLGKDKENATEEMIASAITSATPADLIKLREADQQFTVEMRKLDVDLAKVDAGDRSDARAREVALKDWVTKILALGVFGTFGGVLFVLTRHLIPDGNKDVFNLILGGLVNSVSTVLGYYFGSSQSSRTKDEAMAQAISK